MVTIFQTFPSLMLTVLPSSLGIVLWRCDNLMKALGVAHCQHLVKIPDHQNELFFPRFTASNAQTIERNTRISQLVII